MDPVTDPTPAPYSGPYTPTPTAPTPEPTPTPAPEPAPAVPTVLAVDWSAVEAAVKKLEGDALAEAHAAVATLLAKLEALA